MESLEEFGKRVQAARIAKRLPLARAAKESKIARDTWGKIEKGGSTQDGKRRIAADFLGIPYEPEPEPEPTFTWEDVSQLGPRLSGIDRQLDALWQRVEQLEQRLEEGGGGHADDTDGPAANPVPESGPANQPDMSDPVSRDDFALAADEQGEIAGEQEDYHET